MKGGRWCKCCGKKQVLHVGCNRYDKVLKPFKCLDCNTLHSHKDLGIKKKNFNHVHLNNSEKVKALNKALFEQCAYIMSKNRKKA